MRKYVKWVGTAVVFLLVFLVVSGRLPFTVYANSTLVPSLSINVGGTDDPSEVVPALQALFIIGLVTLAPSLLLLLTGFTRILISLHFVRSAMGTQQMPPNQVMIGIALILTLYLMGSQLSEINENALQPFGEGLISAEEAIDRGMAPLLQFMRKQAEEKDVALFVELSGGGVYETIDDIPDRIIIPAFILGELTKGFIIGFVMYLPFIVIDMVVASVLMAMGMMMLPPAMISTPFKILLFLLSGGWNFVIKYVMMTFR